MMSTESSGARYREVMMEWGFWRELYDMNEGGMQNQSLERKGERGRVLFLVAGVGHYGYLFSSV